MGRVQVTVSWSVGLVSGCAHIALVQSAVNMLVSYDIIHTSTVYSLCKLQFWDSMKKHCIHVNDVHIHVHVQFAFFVHT